MNFVSSQTQKYFSIDTYAISVIMVINKKFFFKYSSFFLYEFIYFFEKF